MDVQTSSSNVDLTEINEYSEEGIREQEKLWPCLNIRKLCLEKAIEHRKTRKKLQRAPAYNHQMRSEFSRLKTFLSWSTRSTWSPQEMASAGFYSTGLNESIQCFSCGLVLCIQVVKVTPMTRHKKMNPMCDFIQGEDVGNIPKYDTRVQFPAEGAVDSAKTYKEEEERLESFKSWPHYAKTEPSKLARAGWIFTGRKDIVQCFSCKGCLGNWEEDDDPWKEHAKWFPECKFLHNEKSETVIEGYIQNYQGYRGFTGKDFIESWNKRISLGETEHPVFSIYEDEAVRFESFRTWKQEGDVNAETWARLGFFYTGSTIVNVYQDEAIRLNSFENWPEDAHADPATLAKVGFFYTGRSDIVTCFCCGLGLCTFEDGDDPWKEHKRYQPDCKHLISKMPKEDDKDPVESQPTGPLTESNVSKTLTEKTEDVVSFVKELIVKELNTLDCLKELTLSLHKGSKVFGELLKNFDKHINMEKLAITTYTLTKDDCSGLIEYIQNCKNLRVFYLESRCFYDFGALTIALSKCENIQEIRLKDFFQYKEIIDLGTSLPHLTSLKVLDLSGLHVMIEDISENFALQLGSLVNLEELGLPLGKGMRQVAKLVIEQLQRFPMLRILKCNQILTDESLLQLAHTARDGYFLNLETLRCDLCNDITEPGWRDFFQTMDNLPHLKELSISRAYPNLIKSHPTTVTAFVQFISRLPSIIEVLVYGLLFDAEDLAMFNSMKEKHPQSKNLTLYWQLSLPYSPL